MDNSVVVENALTIMNNCVACVEMYEDEVEGRCPDCTDKFETNQIVLAHNLVDEDADVYRYAPMYKSLTKINDEPSGHDWIAPLVRIGSRVRQEFVEPVVHLADRIFDEDEDLDVPSNQVICQWCYLQCNKYVVCPNCEGVNA